MGDADVDDEDDLPCYRHPGRMTALQCVQCDRAICTDCAIQAPVGLKCPECGRLPKAARGTVPPAAVVRGSAAAAAVASVIGTVLFVVPVPFLGIILAYFGGAATGTVAVRASGGFRDPALARVATVLAAVGMLAPPFGLALLGGYLPALVASQGFVWLLLGAAAAAWGAWSRAS